MQIPVADVGNTKPSGNTKHKCLAEALNRKGTKAEHIRKLGFVPQTFIPDTRNGHRLDKAKKHKQNWHDSIGDTNIVETDFKSKFSRMTPKEIPTKIPSRHPNTARKTAVIPPRPRHRYRLAGSSGWVYNVTQLELDRSVPSHTASRNQGLQTFIHQFMMTHIISLYIWGLRRKVY